MKREQDWKTASWLCTPRKEADSYAAKDRVVALQSVWSGNRRSLGTFLHSPMLDELKSLEAMLMQRVTLFHPKQKDVMCSSGPASVNAEAMRACLWQHYSVRHGVAVLRPDGDMAPVQL